MERGRSATTEQAPASVFPHPSQRGYGGTMFGFAWLALRQAHEALRSERLEEAHRLLCQSCVRGHKRSFELLARLADGYVARGQRRLAEHDVTAAWKDLAAADEVGGMAH